VKLLIILIESFRFAWATGLLWPRMWRRWAYWHWRLGTVYGSFDRETGEPRKMRELLRDLWRDRAAAGRFMLWRREMRRLARSGR